MRRTASGPGGKPVARNELGGMIDVLGKIVEHQLVHPDVGGSDPR
jgi:hypothetical protein